MTTLLNLETNNKLKMKKILNLVKNQMMILILMKRRKRSKLIKKNSLN